MAIEIQEQLHRRAGVAMKLSQAGERIGLGRIGWAGLDDGNLIEALACADRAITTRPVTEQIRPGVRRSGGRRREQRAIFKPLNVALAFSLGILLLAAVADGAWADDTARGSARFPGAHKPWTPSAELWETSAVLPEVSASRVGEQRDKQATAFAAGEKRLPVATPRWTHDRPRGQN